MIKNIIFDFGDIFINLDKKAPDKALATWGVATLDQDLLKLNNAYEKGLVSTDAFIQTYLDKNAILNVNRFKMAWNSILLNFPQHRLDWLIRLSKSKKYRLFLLSNTNELHIEAVIKIMGALRYAQFQQCFERFYLSQEIHLRKPEPEIYEFVLKENSLTAGETIFIDDLPYNTEAAAKQGIQTWNLDVGNQDITDLFKLHKSLFD